MKVLFIDFIQVFVWVDIEDKLDYLKNTLLDFKKYFCLGFL